AVLEVRALSAALYARVQGERALDGDARALAGEDHEDPRRACRCVPEGGRTRALECARPRPREAARARARAARLRALEAALATAHGALLAARRRVRRAGRANEVAARLRMECRAGARQRRDQLRGRAAYGRRADGVVSRSGPAAAPAASPDP